MPLSVIDLGVNCLFVICAVNDFYAGAYVSTVDALNSTISADELWKEGKFERAIALMAVRALVFDRGLGAVGKDSTAIHGED